MNPVNTAVTYTLSHCVSCMSCVRVCPTSALTMQDHRISIDDSKCINCAQCIRTCHHQGLTAKGSTLEDLKNYDFRVALIPSAMMSRAATVEEAGALLNAVRLLGFDAVIDISDVEGAVLTKTNELAARSSEPVIASLCPVVRQLIRNKYPTLVENLAPYDDPCEIAARLARKKYADKGNVGIFYFSECEAKLVLAKYPYGHMNQEVDHALSIVDILPLIRENLGRGRTEVSLCREGLLAVNPMMMKQTSNDLIADGFSKIDEILDMQEFNLLHTFRVLHLYTCINGCIGGHLLWGNSYLVKNNYESLTALTSRRPAEIPEELLLRPENAEEEAKDSRTLSERLAYFNKVNDQLAALPGYDCSACGMQTCRDMAEEIVKGNRTLDDCHILHHIKEMKAHEGK